MTHALKTWPEYFELLSKGDKLFEIRKDDRPYKNADDVLLQEYDPKTQTYTGKELRFNICFILRNLPKNFGLKPGFCVLGLKPKE